MREVKRSRLYNEINEVDSFVAKDLFHYTQHKIIEKVDSFYYNVFIRSDSSSISEYLEDFFQHLRFLKDSIESPDDLVEFKGLTVKLGTYGVIYKYRLSEEDKFDIFITDYLPNVNTARVVVQIRSNALWLDGFDSVLQESFDKVKEIFSDYEEIDLYRTLENRIDYAYHTNSIQNPTKFFSDKNLNSKLKTTLKLYHKVGDVESDHLTIDYFSLGNRSSNNIFFRAYNKTREVVEMGYKSFFIEYWYKNKMISKYDKYCLEIAYKSKDYNALHRARLMFYLEFGRYSLAKDKIRIALKKYSCSEIKELADKICPPVTLVLNFEYQTKRKFYYYADEQIDLLPHDDISDLALKRLYKIYNNRKLFLDELTSKTVSFQDRSKDKYLSFWERLRNVKLDDCYKIDSKYLRKYNADINFDIMKKRFINTVATSSIYKSSVDSDFVDDLSSLLSCLNDNDIKTLADANGEVVRALKGICIDEYGEYKKKRYSELKNKIRQADKNNV